MYGNCLEKKHTMVGSPKMVKVSEKLTRRCRSLVSIVPLTQTHTLIYSRSTVLGLWKFFSMLMGTAFSHVSHKIECTKRDREHDSRRQELTSETVPYVFVCDGSLPVG